MDQGGCGNHEPFALRVLGDSMTPEFDEGAIIIIDPAGVIEHGAYVIARHDGEFIFRQLAIERERYFLRPLNDLYEEIEVESIEAVVGVVVQKAGRRRKDHKHYV